MPELHRQTCVLPQFAYPLSGYISPICQRILCQLQYVLHTPYAQTYIRVLLQVFHPCTTPYVPSGGSLKLILSNHAGSRFQMDLTKMPPCRGYTQILRVVDHLLKYGNVTPMRSKNATECTNALLRIISGSIMPKIL